MREPAGLQILPDGGHIPQGGNDAGQLFQDVVHILLGVGLGQRQPQGAVRDFGRAPDRQQYVARLQGAGGTRRAGRSADAGKIQPEKLPLRLVPVEVPAGRVASQTTPKT